MDTHGTPVPTQWEGRGWLDRTHEHMARGTQQTRKTPKKIHEVTNMDSMIRAHGSGACCGHTGEQFCQRLPGTDTANEELSTVTEYLTKSNDMCAVVTELDDTRHPEHCAQPRTREGWMECRLS